MIERFVDTSGWAEFADQTLLFHSQAKTLFEEVWQNRGHLVTTNLVLVELTALLKSPLRWPKPQQIQFLDDIRYDASTIIVTIDAALEAAAWNLWQSRPDKDWTLVDCASFVIMQQQRLTDALSTDHHFEQAGFVRLLK